MKTFIHEIGIIDKSNNKHPVFFKKGFNVVTGKSSTGKSSLIEIFDYCFGSSENTIPKGVITNNASIYYVVLNINSQNIVIARNPDLSNKAFCRKIDKYNKDCVQYNYFQDNYFMALNKFKQYLRGFFLDIDDVDKSLAVKNNRRNRKAATPSIRSFTSFMLQHQNLVANKHALFYRFDEKEKRDQVIEHTKIFLGLVDQQYFLLSQEKERITNSINQLKRQQESNRKIAESYKEKVEPVLIHLYSMMGFDKEPLSIKKLIEHPQEAQDMLDKIIVPEKINYHSDSLSERYYILKQERTLKKSELGKLQRQAKSLSKHIAEDELFFKNFSKLESPDKVYISSTVCPFCHVEKKELGQSAKKLQEVIIKVSDNLAHSRPIKAKFESVLVDVNKKIEEVKEKLTDLNQQISKIEKNNEELAKQKTLYESILIEKANLFMLLNAIKLSDDIELEKKCISFENELKIINKKLNRYNIRKGLEQATLKINEYMYQIGSQFEFEDSYKPINLHFSFETFDLYHLTSTGDKIFLRSMGSGANWLYSHITLFLALHRFFVELGDNCSIPSILFLDQPTQVYFPNFGRDDSESFEVQKDKEEEQRTKKDRPVDEDITSVENLFSQLSIYCNELQDKNGFCPQIIITDHADHLRLSNGVSFESLVNGNRWRKRGLIHPLPKEIQK